MAKRIYEETLINTENESTFKLLNKDDITKIMTSYQNKADIDLNNMKELFKQTYKYDEVEDKCIDLKNESLDDLYTFNKKTFENSITIMETLKDTLKLSEEFINGNVSFSNDINPIIFIDILKRLYENEHKYITEEKYEYEIYDNIEYIDNVLKNENNDLLKLNKTMDKIIKKKSVIDNEYFSSLEFYKELTVKYEILIENAYDTYEIDKYILMVKTTVDIYDINYKLMYSDNITLDRIDSCIDILHFLIKRMRELLCSTAYKITKIDNNFEKSEIYKQNVNVSKCIETIQAIENEKLQQKQQKSFIYKFFEYVKNKVSKLISVFLKSSGTILYHIKTYIIKAYISCANTFFFKTLSSGIVKEIKKELIYGYLGSKVTGKLYEFDYIKKYNKYILPNDKILKSETVMFIQIIQILGIIFCSSLGTQKQFWNFTHKITNKLIKYIDKVYEIKFIRSGTDVIKKFFSVIYTTLGYCGDLFIDKIYSEFVYSIFSFICGNMIKIVSNSISDVTNIIKSLCVSFGDKMATSAISLYEYVLNIIKNNNVDLLLSDNETDNLINNVIENGLESIKNTYSDNKGCSLYLGELNPFNLTAGMDIKKLHTINISQTESVKIAGAFTSGTVIGSIINNITHETEKSTVNHTRKLHNIDDIKNEIKKMDIQNIDIQKLSEDVDDLSSKIANEALSESVDIISNSTQYIIKDKKYKNESIEIKNDINSLNKDFMKLLKNNISKELYNNASENVIKKNSVSYKENKIELLNQINKKENKYNEQKETNTLLQRIIDLIIKLLNIISNISITQILYMIKENAYNIAKTSYTRISEGIKQICIKAMNLPSVCYNSLSEVTVDVILNKIKLFGEQRLENIKYICSSPKKFFKLLKNSQKFIKYVSDLRYIIYGTRLKIPKIDKILLGYSLKSGKYIGGRALEGSKYIGEKALEGSEYIGKKYRQIKYGPKTYNGENPLTSEEIKDIIETKRKRTRIE